MTTLDSSRRTVLRTALWSAPAITVAAAAPAFADSSAGAASLSVAPTSGDRGEVVVRNEGTAPVAVELIFSPTPDEAAPWTLQAYSGFEGLAPSSTAPYVLAGSVAAGAEVSGSAWWRTLTGESGRTTVELKAAGRRVDSIDVPLQG